MDVEEFRQRGKEMVDIIADYYSTIRDRRVLPDVKPGFMISLIPSEAPHEPETWQDVVKDIERVIMPGTTHWQHPQFHAYFPSGYSFPSLLAEMLCTGVSQVGFTWMASPAVTELELIVLDWLGKALRLPSDFLWKSLSGETQEGGGVIQSSASEAILVAMLAARNEAVKKLQSGAPGLKDHEAFGKLIAYGSDQVHSAFDKDAVIAGVKFRKLETDEEFSLGGGTLEDAIKEDTQAGLHPFYLMATLGTTSSCAFDNLVELGPVCEKYGLWMHIDAAYAGSAFICPEYRPLLDGAEYAESYNFNAHKWMLTTFGCSCMWVKRRSAVMNAFKVDPVYLRNPASETGRVVDYMHMEIPLGIQQFIRKHIELAKKFENLVRATDIFEIPVKPVLGLVCFRLKGSNELNSDFLKAINDSGKVHMIGTDLRGQFVLRMVVGSVQTTESDIDVTWKIITSIAESVMKKNL